MPDKQQENNNFNNNSAAHNMPWYKKTNNYYLEFCIMFFLLVIISIAIPIGIYSSFKSLSGAGYSWQGSLWAGSILLPVAFIFTNTLPPDYLTLNPKLGCICPVGVFYIVAQLIASVAICFTVGFWCRDLARTPSDDPSRRISDREPRRCRFCIAPRIVTLGNGGALPSLFANTICGEREMG